MRQGEGNIHDLINYVIMWICSGYDTWVTFEGRYSGNSSILHSLLLKLEINVEFVPGHGSLKRLFQSFLLN